MRQLRLPFFVAAQEDDCLLPLVERFERSGGSDDHGSGQPVLYQWRMGRRV